jgi:hypothetical protein
MNIREYLTAILLGIISALIYDLITKKFPSFDILKNILLFTGRYLSEYYSAILIFLVAFFLMILYYKNEGRMSFHVISSPQKPKYVQLKGFHFRFGVI